MLSKQQPRCPVAASSLINQPAKCPCIPTTPRGLGLGQGPQGSEMGWVGAGGLVLGSPSLGLCSLLSWTLSRLFVSWNGLPPGATIVRASTTNHLWGSTRGGGVRGEEG